jgi:hypothetical protein
VRGDHLQQFWHPCRPPVSMFRSPVVMQSHLEQIKPPSTFKRTKSLSGPIMNSRYTAESPVLSPPNSTAVFCIVIMNVYPIHVLRNDCLHIFFAFQPYCAASSRVVHRPSDLFIALFSFTCTTVQIKSSTVTFELCTEE